MSVRLANELATSKTIHFLAGEDQRVFDTGTYHSLRWFFVQVPVAWCAFAGDASVRPDASKPKRAEDFHEGAMVSQKTDWQTVYFDLRDEMDSKLPFHSD